MVLNQCGRRVSCYSSLDRDFRIHLQPALSEGQRQAVEYKHFFVKAFQREPAKWRASVKRLDGKPLMLVSPDRLKLDQFITGVDSLTPKDALLLAVAAIDAGTFSRRSAERGTATDMLPRRGPWPSKPRWPKKKAPK